MPRKKKSEVTVEQPNTEIESVKETSESPAEEQMIQKEKRSEFPDLNSWVPKKEDLYFIFDGNVVNARFSDILGETFEGLNTFLIIKKHYKERMNDITQHINYFIKFYDTEREFFVSMLSMKYMIDRNRDLSQEHFKTLILARIITDTFVQNITRMAKDLYTININTDKEGKYKSTPKITNDHAKIILALSFAIRTILPLCIHYSNTNNTIVANRDYIKCFDTIFMGVLTRFEKINQIEIFNPICRFVQYRLDRSYNADSLIWSKKQQLYGINYETVFQELIHEVILVKSLYKISYDRSVVSYIDGVVSNSYNHFRFENFKYKPVEIEADNGGSDSDDYLSHAEALEMSIYRIDESNQLINDVNNRNVMQMILRRFSGCEISEEEFQFYKENCKINSLTKMFLNSFYARFFQSSTAIYTLTLDETICLLIILKKYLSARGMTILPQICTAKVKGKFKENLIKNSRFIEKFRTSSVYQNIIHDKFKYIYDLNPKEDPNVKTLSTIINSSFELVDPDPEINGMNIDDMPMDKIIDEFLVFLSII